MKISDILSEGRPALSFEVFPPKAGVAIDTVKGAVREIAATHPAFVSVTYGAAGGTTGVNTSELASFVQGECGVAALAHLTCVMETREGIAAEATRLAELGVENILALRGDLPPSGGVAPGHFRHACELVSFLRKSFPSFCLGGACYPECHPECRHLDEDIAYLRGKVDAGLDFLTTQMFFDNCVFFKYLARLRNAGVTIPVIAGVMPVTSGQQIRRICALSGTHLPPRFTAIVDRFGDDPASMMDAGVAYATEQIVDLFANGASFVHVYTMNKPEVARRISANLGNVLAR